MIFFYCPNCWTRIKEDEKVCHECKAEVEPFDHLSYFERLVRALNHPERTTRIRAAYILGELGDKRAIQPLVNASKKTRDLFLIEGIAIALGRMDDDRVVPALIELNKHQSFLVRKAALISLSRFKKKEALAAIREAQNDPSPSVQELAQQILQENSRLKRKSPD